MHICCTKNNGIDYLQVQESYYENLNGKPKQRKRVVKNLGPLSRFDDGRPDYLRRLRTSFREGNPIIPELNELLTSPPTTVSVQFDLTNPSDCACDPKNIGYFLLDALYNAIGVYDVLNSHKSRAQLSYDLNALTKLLVFGRVLWPESKRATFERRSNYLYDIANSSSEHEIYLALDELDQKSNAIQKRMNLKITQSIGRNTEICFYDVTNYYFEIDENDPDGGLRKRGVSKENRNQPIAQMGLFIDDNGIPISFQMFPGNHTDITTLRPAMRKTIDKMEFGRIIIVADGGLNSGPNIAHILDCGNGYIVSKSTKKSDKTVKAWMLEETGYQWNDARTFKVKSQIRTRTIKAEDGSSRTITEKLICYWSKKHYERERHENEKFIEYLESVIAFPDKLKDKPRKIEKFLKRTSINKTTGEVINVHNELSLDMDKIREYLDLMGYYTIMTSEIDKSDEEIISKYHGLSRIEDSFRITKSDLEGRPVFVRTPEHINAHFLTCFIALTMLRLIQYRILKYLGKDTTNELGWESGLSAERIQTALHQWCADALPGGYFRLTHISDDLRLILDSLGIDADLRLPNAKQLRQLKHNFADMLL